MQTTGSFKLLVTVTKRTASAEGGVGVSSQVVEFNSFEDADIAFGNLKLAKEAFTDCSIEAVKLYDVSWKQTSEVATVLNPSRGAIA